MSAFLYSLHLRVLASDCELPFLFPAPPRSDADITLRLTPAADAPPATFWYRAESSIIDRTDGGDLILHFHDDTHFLVRHDGRAISLLAAPREYTRDDLAAYALGPVLTVALHLLGAVLLHASAVVINGKAVLFAGPSGSGKSTTAAMLHRAGYDVLSDDVTEVAGTFAFGSVPALRLWPDVLDVLYGSAAAFPDRAPSWDKKVVRTGASDAAAKEIAAILFLEPRDGEAQLRRLEPRTGWTRMIADAPTAKLSEPAMERKIFEVTSALADGVPMYTFVPPPVAQSSTLGRWLEERLQWS